MDKDDFKLEQRRGLYTGHYKGFKTEIDRQHMSDEKIKFAKAIIEAYPQKLKAIAEFCETSEALGYCYPAETADDIVRKLGLPILRVDDTGGSFTYCNHQPDEDHIIEVEFTGLIDGFFSVNIDG